jgi:hypothetical protein
MVRNGSRGASDVDWARTFWRSTRQPRRPRQGFKPSCPARTPDQRGRTCPNRQLAFPVQCCRALSPREPSRTLTIRPCPPTDHRNLLHGEGSTTSVDCPSRRSATSNLTRSLPLSSADHFARLIAFIPEAPGIVVTETLLKPKQLTSRQHAKSMRDKPFVAALRLRCCLGQ